jgi:CMP-N-acetylneuraminic acid synthetase
MMKVVIPAKLNSTRVHNKNWRQFSGGENLVDIKIKQVLKATSHESVYLSCDDLSLKTYADKYEINFLHRSPEFASDSTSWPDAFSGMINETPIGENEDIAWVEVINPLFDDYRALFGKWDEMKNEYDSLVLAAPFNKYLFTGSGRPVNFQFGKWHDMSQNLSHYFTWDSACIMPKKKMLYFSYPIGKKPFIYSTGDNCIDIDTMADFEIAKILYARKYEAKTQA